MMTRQQYTELNMLVSMVQDRINLQKILDTINQYPDGPRRQTLLQTAGRRWFELGG